MNNLKLQVILSAIDKLSAPFRSASKQAQELASSLKQQKGALAELKKSKRRITLGSNNIGKRLTR